MTAAAGRKFAFTVGAAFLVLGALLWWRGRELPATVFGSLAALLGLLGAVVPDRLGPVERAWMGLAHLISKVTTPIFMGVVFFVVITPIALLLRLIGKSPMRARRGAATYWVPRDASATRGDLTRQF